MTNRRKMRRSVQSVCFGTSAIVCLALMRLALICLAIVQGSVAARASPADTPGEAVVAGSSATGGDQLSPACDDSPMSTACPQPGKRA